MVGPLQALLEQEKAAKQKLKDRRQVAVAAGYERRSLLEVKERAAAPKCSAARRDSIRNSREARRPLVPDGNSAGPGALIESLMKPTALYQMRAAEKRRSDAPMEEKKPEEPSGETEAQCRLKWDKFLRRNSAFQQNKEDYLEGERQKIQDQELQGCTFHPMKVESRRSSASSGSSGGRPGSMFERSQQMEERKQAKMQKMRQELVNREMAQCSFTPKILGSPREPTGLSNIGSRRSSFDAGGGYMPRTSGNWEAALGPADMANHPHRDWDCHANAASYEPSEGSECWEGSRDEEVSLGSGEHQEGFAAEDVTILPPSGGRTFQAWSSAPPSSVALAQTAPAQPASDEMTNDQFKVLRLEERRKLLEETLSPCKSPGVSSFAAALRMNASRRGPPAGSAGVAEAVERMEVLLDLSGNLSDLSDFDDEFDDEEKPVEEEDSKAWSDEEDGDIVLDLDNLEPIAEASVWGGKFKSEQLQSELPPTSPSRGGG